MNISKNKVVSLYYALRTQQGGEIVDQSQEDRPLEFLFGSGMLLEKFEANIEGLSEGDKFSFHLSPEEGYGAYNNELIVDIPKHVFDRNPEMLVVGNVIPMQDNKGNHMRGTIKEILSEIVKIDFNHPMAGQDLYFEGSIKEIREASEEEIEHGHVHHHGHCCHHEGKEHCHKHDNDHCCHEHEHDENHCCHKDEHEHEENNCCHKDEQ